jgi:hypothetical protein
MDGILIEVLLLHIETKVQVEWVEFYIAFLACCRLHFQLEILDGK